MRLTKAAILRAATARTESGITDAIATGLLTPTLALARVWLTHPTGDLYLAGSAGAPAGGGAYKNLEGSFARIARGAGKIGHIAAHRESVIVTSVRGDEDWISNPQWIARQAVRSFCGIPLVHAGNVLGVIAIFERSSLTRDQIEELHFLAEYTAARLTEVRERAPLPASSIDVTPRASQAVAAAGPRIVTREDLRALERETITTALAHTSGRVFGPKGAALLLGMKPTTLASRIKVLGLRVR